MSNQLLFGILLAVFLHHGLGMTNFALHKPAVQSSILNWLFYWTADRAVDGNNTGWDPDNSRTCSSTEDSGSGKQTNNTWEVNIGFPIIMKTITVYGRTDGGFGTGLDGIKLYFRNISGPSILNQEFVNNLSNNSRYVYTPTHAIASVVSLMNTGRIMFICEVTIDGECLDGNFSELCNETCGKCFADKPCNKTDGTCPSGCSKGWNGLLCIEACERGTYGYDCNNTCGKCLYGNDNCSTSDGNCTNGCQEGWQGVQCDKACDKGKYGYNCNNTCGKCLYGNDNCLTSDGNCTNGCQAGWQGLKCDTECDRGFYGLNCSEKCGNCINGKNTCSPLNGNCSGNCQAGWNGATCKSECMAGTYGLNCGENCGHCLNGPSNCSKIDGLCTGGCLAGWMGEQCKQGTEVMSSSGDVQNVGVIVGSVAAAVGVSVFAIATIVIVKKRKKTNIERRADELTTVPQYANLVVGNPDAAFKITDRSQPETNSAYSAKEEESIANIIPISVKNSHTEVMGPHVHASSDYEQLQDATRSAESSYSTIKHNHRDSVPTLQSIDEELKILDEKRKCLLASKEILQRQEVLTSAQTKK